MTAYFNVPWEHRSTRIRDPKPQPEREPDQPVVLGALDQLAIVPDPGVEAVVRVNGQPVALATRLPVGSEHIATRFADEECAHGRLPGDRTPPCGCWPGEAAPVPDVIPNWVLADASFRRIARIAPENVPSCEELLRLAARVLKARAAVKAVQPLALLAPTREETMNDSPTATEAGLRERMGAVYTLAENAGEAGFTRADTEKALGINDTQAGYLLRKMADDGQIEMRGQTFSRRYYALGDAPEADTPARPTIPRKQPKRAASSQSKFEPALTALREERQGVRAQLEQLQERQRMLAEAITTLEQLEG